LTIISQCWKNTPSLFSLALFKKILFRSENHWPFGIGIKLDFKAATSTLLGHSLAQALQLTHNSKRHTIPYD
jgi:hypothetical protein